MNSNVLKLTSTAHTGGQQKSQILKNVSVEPAVGAIATKQI